MLKHRNTIHRALLAIFLLGSVAVTAGDPATVNSSAHRPNIVFIFADDLGYGDIGAFGAKDIKTPHIDKLADDGIKFTDFYSASNVCSTSRASLLTGRYSVRMGISAVFTASSPDGMPQSEVTIAEALKPQGYATGMVGKWHLGHNDRFMPWNQGFDEFYGVPYSNDMGSFYWYENQDILYEDIDQQYLTKRYTDKAIDFINRHQSQPFFLYLAHSMPHVPLYASPNFQGKSERGLYGDVVQELDWSVGEIVRTLKAKGLWENTLLVFSSDNGPWLMMADHGGSPGILHNGKMTTFDGGHRVPTIAHWPNGIKSREVQQVASMLDWFPTFVELAGAPVLEDREIDGTSLGPLLAGEDSDIEAEYAYFDKSNKKVDAVRHGKWKLKRARSSMTPAFIENIAQFGEYSHPLMLIDLVADPGETNNLAQQHPVKVEALQQLFAKYDEMEPDQRWLVMGGTSSDHKGYGHMYTVLSVLAITALVFIVGLIYGSYRLIRYAFTRRKHKKKTTV